MYIYYGRFGHLDISKKDILESLEQHHGIVSIACKNIGLARSTFYNWVATDPEFKKEVDEIQEVAIDHVESKLFEKINGVWTEGRGEDEDGEPLVYKQPPSDTAIIFYLKTKGKKRGYIEKSEIDHTSGGEKLNIPPIIWANGNASGQD